MRAFARRSAWMLIATCMLNGCSDQKGDASNEPGIGGGGGGKGGGSLDGAAGWPDGGPDSASGGAQLDAGGSGGTGGGDAGVSEASAGSGGTTPVCPTIQVTSAVYAGNCGASTNVASVATQCNAKQTCSYTMNYTVDPGYDPAPGCAKDMGVAYNCMNGSSVVSQKNAYAAPEAGVGSVLTLDCNPCS